MHLPTVRPLLAAAAAGAALILFSACGGGSPPTADSAAHPSTASSGAGAPASAGAGASTSPGGSGGAGSSGSGQPAGGSGSATGAKTLPRPCTLLSSGEAGSALNVSGALTTKTNTADECEYDASDGSSVDLAVQRVPFTPDLPNAIAQIAPAGQVKRINGLGDAAILFTPAADQAQMYVWKDGLAVTINVDGVAQAGSSATSIGTVVAGRI
jgi:hypothetical protein